MKMNVKHYKDSPHCWLNLKIKIPHDWVEQLELLVQSSGLRTIENYVKTLLAADLLNEKKTIEKQRQKNIK